MEERHERVEVHVKSLKTGERVHFEVPESDTLEMVWDEANKKLTIRYLNWQKKNLM